VGVVYALFRDSSDDHGAIKRNRFGTETLDPIWTKRRLSWYRI